MAKIPLLSILVLTYNRKDMLRQCLDSIRDTTIQDREIVILDDASSDGTDGLVHEYMRRDPTIRYIRNPVNVGPTNGPRLMAEARGEYRCIICDDDSVVKGNFEKKVALLEANPAVNFVYSRWFITDANNQNPQVPNWAGHALYSYVGGRNEFMDLLTGNHIHLGSMVYRRSIWEELGDVDFDLGVALADWDMVLRWSRDRPTAFINEPLFNVRFHQASVTHQFGIAGGGFVKGQLAVWRKWLVQDERPPVVEDRVWGMMQNTFQGALNGCLADHPEEREAYLAQFAQLKNDHRQVMSRVFASASRNLPDTLVPLPSQWERLGEGSSSCAGKTPLRRPRHPHLTSPASGRGTISNNLPALVWSGNALDLAEGGAELRSLIRTLDAAGVTCRLEDPAGSLQESWSGPALLGEDDARFFDALRWRPVKAGRPYIRVWHGEPTACQPDDQATAVVCRTSFPVDGLPQEWVRRCNELDGIWVPNGFARDSFERAGVTPGKLEVVPACLDLSRYGEGIPPVPLDTERGFNFLSVVSWDELSGWDILVRAWAQAFQPDEDVALIFVAHSAAGKTLEQIGANIQQKLTDDLGNKPVAPIRLFSAWPSATDLPNMFRAVQACVQPSRGDAWGRSILAAIASNRPVIAPKWGASLDLLTEESGWLVDAEARPAPAHLFNGSGSSFTWAEPSPDHLAVLLRQVVDNQKLAAKRAALALASVSDRLAPAAYRERLQGAIECQTPTR